MGSPESKSAFQSRAGTIHNKLLNGRDGIGEIIRASSPPDHTWSEPSLWLEHVRSSFMKNNASFGNIFCPRLPTLASTEHAMRWHEHYFKVGVGVSKSFYWAPLGLVQRHAANRSITDGRFNIFPLQRVTAQSLFVLDLGSTSH